MEVFLLGYMPEVERITGAAGWATRSLECTKEYLRHVKDEEVRDMIRYAKTMKLSSVLNFPYFLFGFKDVSRSFTHQWVRYRLAAHMQQSLRYVRLSTSKLWFVIPPPILKSGAKTIAEFIQKQQQSADSYQKLVDGGVDPEDARFVLPLGTKTHITTAMNAEELLHVFNQRCCIDAQWEIRTGAFALATACMIVSPDIFGDFGSYCLTEDICRGKGKKVCKPLTEKNRDNLRQIAKKEREKFENLESGDELVVDLTDGIGYRVPKKVVDEVEKILGWRPELDYEVKATIRKV